MAFRVKRLAAIRARPSREADRLFGTGKGSVFIGTGRTFVAEDGSPEAGTAWTNVLLPDERLDGWIEAAFCDEVEDPVPPALDVESFVRHCLMVERSLNADEALAPWFVTTDFLIARALFETGMAAVLPDAAQRSGPLRLSPAEWDGFLASGLAVAKEFGEGDRRYVLAQAFAAGHAMHAAAKAFSATAAATAGGTTPDDGPVIPSYLDLFHCHLIGAEKAFALSTVQPGDTRLLSDILPAETLGAISDRPKLTGLGKAKTAGDFVRMTETVLADLLDAAFDAMATLAADELPRKPAGGVPGGTPWLQVARSEESQGVKEGTSDDRIRSYFAATDFGGVGNAIPHWCGAFAAHCVSQAGAKPPKGAAVAANWKKWGDRSVPVGTNEVPPGAIVVLKPPPNTKTSGHVAFFVRFANGRSITLLGGNQSDSVRESDFPITSVAAIRVLGDATSTNGAANDFDMTAAGVKKEFQPFGDLIVDHFRRAGFDKTQHLVAALANAIAESGLDPGQSFGLFQCNRTHGLGKGHSIEMLKDPAFNTSLVIAEARKVKSFVAASTIEAAVEAFVRFVERPLDKEGAIRKRTEIAHKLL